jgi:integrase
MKDLHAALADYVAARRALGSQFRWPASLLRRFVDFLDQEGATFITTELAVRWATEPVDVQRATHAGRLSLVRRFAAWLSVFDARTQVPPRRLLRAYHRRNTPHIYTDQEILSLMAEAARLPSSKGLHAQTHVTLVGLLAATGLRPGEALALDARDVDLQNGILTIRQTKFGKSRFVPLDETTRVALTQYVERRDAAVRRLRTAAFLITERGTRLNKLATRRTFAKVSCAVGLRAPMGGRRIGWGPRLQDLRHTFATRRLIEWYRAGCDVERELPKLAMYLGHARIANTYWYLQAVPELLQLATERCASRRGEDSR